MSSLVVLWWCVALCTGCGGVGFGPFHSSDAPSISEWYTLGFYRILQYPSFPFMSLSTMSTRCCFSFNWSVRIRTHQHADPGSTYLLHILSMLLAGYCSLRPRPFQQSEENTTGSHSRISTYFFVAMPMYSTLSLRVNGLSVWLLTQVVSRSLPMRIRSYALLPTHSYWLISSSLSFLNYTFFLLNAVWKLFWHCQRAF